MHVILKEKEFKKVVEKLGRAEVSISPVQEHKGDIERNIWTFKERGR